MSESVINGKVTILVEEIVRYQDFFRVGRRNTMLARSVTDGTSTDSFQYAVFKCFCFHAQV